MSLKLISPPAVEPISLVEAKRHLVIDHDDDDAMIAFLIQVARSHFDAISGWSGRSIMTQTWDLVFDGFPMSLPIPFCGSWRNTPTFQSEAIKVPHPPLQSVAFIKYLDASGAMQTMAPTDYMIDNADPAKAWIIPTSSWPASQATANAVQIRFIAGYASASDVPAHVRYSILMTLGSLYENREQVVVNSNGTVATAEMPFGVDELFSTFRNYSC